MTTRAARCNDQRIEYDDAGDGEPALLGLPGWCTSRGLFAPLVSHLPSKRRLIALDWRGHGGSSQPSRDFGTNELIEDALAVIAESGVRQIVPIAQAHAGWIALELRRRLGERVVGIVSTSWMLADPPTPFRASLAALQDRQQWADTREGLLKMWLAGAPPGVTEHVRSAMTSHGFDMWSRGGREIAASFDRHGSGARALGALEPPVRVLHLFAQPRDPGYLAAQDALARENPWLSVTRVHGESHFPTLEVPEVAAQAIERFLKTL